MNSQSSNSDYIEQNQSYQAYRTHPSVSVSSPPTSQTTVFHLPRRPPQQERSDPTSASSAQQTTIPFAPSPPSPSSESEIYGPDRLFGQRRALYNVAGPVNPYQPGPFETRHLAMATATFINPMAVDDSLKDELVRSAEASITPGVDNTPYLKLALDALSARQDNEGRESDPQSSCGDAGNPTLEFVPPAVAPLFHLPPAHFPLGYAVGDNWTPPPADPPSGPPPIPPVEPLTGANYPVEGTFYERRKTVTPLSERAARRWRRRGDSKGEIVLPYTPSPERLEPKLTESQLFAQNIGRLRAAAVARRPKRDRLPRTMSYWVAEGDEPGDTEKATTHPRLYYKPWILRTSSLSVLAAICVFMVVCLMFSAIYSGRHHEGLVAYSGTIYDGYWFVFRIFPQLLAAVLVIYTQSIITAAFRVLPFSAMASDDIQQRRNVGFLPLYPKSFLWPQLVSTWQFYIPVLVTWGLNFTIPLQSCLFTVVLVDGVWRWKTVQGVAWVLVALYVSMLISVGLMIQFWHRRRTGFLPNWDMRTLADIIMLVAQSNALEAYRGTETAASRNEMRLMLYGNVERLGYWSTPDAPENSKFYSIGISSSQQHIDIEKLGPPIHLKDAQGEVQYTSLAGVEGRSNHSRVRHRYLPWCIRNSQITFWVITSLILLIALFVVCFNPSTDIRHGFLPWLSAAPTRGDFSPADFLYAFLPSLIGLILFLMFQSLDLTLRILTPWGELSRKEGSRANTSILLDYAACLPLESSWKAFKNGHWRVALVSFLSTLFVLIPVLAGGLFMALTPGSGVVRMYPNVAALAVLLTLLVLYVIGLISLIPNRAQFRLPHAVTCLSEIISFCYNEELRTDEAFEFPQNKRFLKAACGAYAELHNQSRWHFGTGQSRSETLGIKKIKRFTVNPRKLRGQDGRALGDVISKPVAGGRVR